MIVHPAVIVHGLPDAREALSLGLPATLLSAPGAAVFAGCLWWLEVMQAARAACPGAPFVDVLDCADASGLAMGALRSGICRLILWSPAPGHDAVCQVAARMGGFVLPRPPPALDLAQRDAPRRLHAWLRG